jgi:thiamine-monophosphate kinase
MSDGSKTQSGEERLIERLFRPIARHPGALGLRDDAALLSPPPGHDLVLTVDAIVAGVHFFSEDPPDTVARKALRVNLSDLAAKGSEPLGALLTLSIPVSTDEKWLEAFARGLGADCEHFRCPLLGGDLTRTAGPLTISVTAIGAVPAGKMVQRKGAKAGDAIVVTGSIGDAALGLMLRREPKRAALDRLPGTAKAHLADRYLLPQPRIALARALSEHASAAIDVSDGLAGDLAKIASVSGVRARFEAKQIPFSPGVRGAIGAEPGLLETALTGGDDYEIAATVSENHLKPLQAAAAEAGIDVTTIGRIEAGEGIEAIGLDGRPLTLRQASFSHF